MKGTEPMMSEGNSLITVAVLATCHNRKDKTLAALEAVYTQRSCAPFTALVYLVDDKSTDGTFAAVQRRFPQTRILHGDGSLYWNGGMRLAFQAAMEDDPDYYLWLNDDTNLYPTALYTLLATAQWAMENDGEPFLIVGSIQDPDTGNLTYGGVGRHRWWHPLTFRPLPPAGVPLPCHTMQGNCVLISRAAARIVGNLSEEFTHGIGDIDYGLRARRLGCTIWVAPGYLGVCERNSQESTWLDPSLPLRQRLRDMSSPKGVPPGEFRTFARRHGGPLWPLFWLLPYRHLFSGLFRRRIGRDERHDLSEGR